jgi:uncharacterized protein YcbK (DUF882 family)
MKAFFYYEVYSHLDYLLKVNQNSKEDFYHIHSLKGLFLANGAKPIAQELHFLEELILDNQNYTQQKIKVLDEISREFSLNNDIEHGCLESFVLNFTKGLAYYLKKKVEVKVHDVFPTWLNTQEDMQIKRACSFIISNILTHSIGTARSRNLKNLASTASIDVHYQKQGHLDQIIFQDDGDLEKAAVTSLASGRGQGVNATKELALKLGGNFQLDIKKNKSIFSFDPTVRNIKLTA